VGIFGEQSEQNGSGQIFLEYQSFPLSLSFHQCSVFMFR